jgi:hypothetical protein
MRNGGSVVEIEQYAMETVLGLANERDFFGSLDLMV